MFKKINPNKDSKGNIYFDVHNIRITKLNSTWGGNPGIRIQAYQGKGKKLHRGAELPIQNKEVAFDLFNVICKALEDEK